jgi:ribokinase
MMQKSVVGIGFCPVDEIIVVPSYPAPGTKISAISSTWQGGGAVATGLVLLSRLGIATHFVSKVGDDGPGHAVVDHMRQKGVDCDAVQAIPGEATSRTLIIVDSSNGKATVITPGNHPARDDLGADPAILQVASILHLDGYFAQDALRLAQLAREQGILVSVNVGRARTGMAELLQLSDVIIASKSYALERCSCSAPEEALAYMREQYRAPVIGVTLQDEGSICWREDDGVVRTDAVAVDVVDDSGSGDVFHGAFLYGLLEGWSLQRIAQFANAAAAYSCQFYGGRAGVPNSEEEVWAFLAQQTGIKED